MPTDGDLHLRGKKENTLVAPIEGLPGSWFGRKLNNPLARWTATIINNYDCSFDHSKLREGLFKELIRNKWRQVLHREGCRVCGKSNTEWSAFHRSVIQLCLCNLSKCPRLLYKGNRVKSTQTTFIQYVCIYMCVCNCLLENRDLTKRMKPKPFPLLMNTSLGSPYLAKSFLNASSVMSLGRLPMKRRHRWVYLFSPGLSNMDSVALNSCQTQK